MSVAIRVTDSGKHRIALYFVDWEKRGTRSAVELFDADTLRMIAPVSLVRGHAGGVYLVYECGGPVKFRFNKVRGELVTLSGIFFDPVGRRESKRMTLSRACQGLCLPCRPGRWLSPLAWFSMAGRPSGVGSRAPAERFPPSSPVPEHGPPPPAPMK
jgi:hypothetical protein